MTRSTQDDRSLPRTPYESLRSKLIARGLPADCTELPMGYKALFIPRIDNESDHAHLFRENGAEAAAPLLSFADDVDFAAWVIDLRKAVLAGLDSVEGFWRKRGVIIGQADPLLHTRKTVTEMVYAEIDALERLHVFTGDRARELKQHLTARVIHQHALDGLTIRDMIDRHNRLGG